PPVLTASASRVRYLSRLNTLPAPSPVNASPSLLRAPPHDSESLWLAKPLTYDSFIHYNLPVYPGALGLMPTLFDPLKVGNIQLDNRIIMAPMTRSRADDEGVQPEYAATYYGQRASAGLIITEATNVSPMAKGYVRTPGIYTNAQIESWRSVTQSAHARGGKIFMQIFHTGRIALPDFLPGNAQPVAPSAVRANGRNYTDEGMKEFVTPREITREEILQTVKDFANAASNAITAGFDGVELHSASGYLVQQFLTTNVNLRTDEYGGSIENRTRFLFQVLDAMLSEIGSQRLGVKFSPQIAFNDIEERDADEVYPYILKHLSEKQLAYVHVADGTGSALKVAPTLQWRLFRKRGLHSSEWRGAVSARRRRRDRIRHQIPGEPRSSGKI
ncbi:MAG TPA: alkene reductase, partial [Pyrinomonadaceae bacterium]|nr:alkene reductase [Pyrinomonadaceae bacterium]